LAHLDLRDDAGNLHLRRGLFERQVFGLSRIARNVEIGSQGAIAVGRIHPVVGTAWGPRFPPTELLLGLFKDVARADGFRSVRRKRAHGHRTNQKDEWVSDHLAGNILSRRELPAGKTMAQPGKLGASNRESYLDPLQHCSLETRRDILT